MATRTITMTNAREVIRLIKLNKSTRKISKLSGVSRTSVKNIINKISQSGLLIDKLLELNDQELHQIIYTPKENNDPRYKKLKQLIPDILKELGNRHENLLHQWEKYIVDDPHGYSYSQFCHHILKEQQADIKTHAVFDYKFGDLLFVDYAGDSVYYTGIDGITVKVKIFVAILPASNYTYAGLSLNETTEAWVEQSTRALEYFDGVPAGIVPDCAKAVVKKADKYEAELNHQYKKFAEHYNTTIIPARPSSPRDKALVENAVNNIYRYIYPRLNAKKCCSFEQLESCFSELLEQYNKREMRRYKKSRLTIFEKNEKKELTALPLNRYIFQRYQAPRNVGVSSHIYLKEDQHYYSVPSRFVNRKCDIYYSINSIKIYCDNELVCIHPRKKGIGKYTTNYDHLSANIKHYMQWEPENAKMKARKYDEAVEMVVTNIFDEQAHHLQARKSVYGIFNLAAKYEKQRFISACRLAVREGAARYSVIKNILEKGLDKTESHQMSFEYGDIFHSNLRYIIKGENI